MSQSNAATSEAVLPDNLLEQVELGSPKGHILVRGTVLRLKLYPEGAPKWVYGELLGVNQAIAFRCPVGYSPRREGEAVVIAGVLKLRASSVRTGVELRIDGEVV